MAKYKLSSNQMKVLNTVFKRFPESQQKIMEKYFSNLEPIQIGMEKYSAKELERFRKKELIIGYGDNRINQIFQKSKTLSRASFNSIPTLTELKNRGVNDVGSKLKSIDEKIVKIDEKIKDSIQKSSSKVYSKFSEDLKSAQSQKRQTQRVKDILKISEMVENTGNKMIKDMNALFKEENSWDIDNNNKYLAETLEKFKENIEHPSNLYAFSVLRNEGIEGLRKEEIDMRDKREREIDWKIESQKWAKPSEVKDIRKEIEKLREDVEKHTYKGVDTKYYRMMRRTPNLYLDKINESYRKDIVIAGIKVKGFGGISIDNIRSSVEGQDSYEPNRRNNIHTFSVTVGNEGEDLIEWNDYDDWDYIPKGYAINTIANFEINKAMLSPVLRTKVADSLKTKGFENLINQKKSLLSERQKLLVKSATTNLFGNYEEMQKSGISEKKYVIEH